MIKKAIVIKNFYPYKNRISILDESGYKLDVSLKKNRESRLFSGALINYSIEKFFLSYLIDDINIIDYPLLVRNNITFFHQVIEILNNCIKNDIAIDNIFEFVSLLYNSRVRFDSNINKLLFKICILLKIGLLPSNFNNYSLDFLSLMAPLLNTNIISSDFFKILEFLYNLDIIAIEQDAKLWIKESLLFSLNFNNNYLQFKAIELY